MSSFSIDYGQVSDMSDSSSENEAKKTPGSQKGSSSGDSTPGDNTSSPLLKKGPWTNAEDAILVEYVRKHGEGNWNAVQKHSGLSRCGKSCRLRWANHLRPDLKKGAFNEEEESLIVELHAKMGNKWARMAAELPGRTDNEIKNYWNTRLKRMQRAGLPLYPPECLEAMKNEGHLGEDAGSGSPAGEKNLYETSQGKEYDIPEFNKFKRLSPPLLDLRSSCIVNNNMSISQNFGFMLSAPPQKRLREIDTPPFPISSLTANGGGFSSFNQNHYDPYSAKPFWPSSYDPGSHGHALINGNNNNSTSEPISATMKLELELPSLQTDTLIQTDCPSPRSSGLLEAIVYESQSLKNSKDHLQISDASTSDSLLETSSQNVDETKWDSIRDAISPLSHSVASVFIDHNNGSSSEQPQSAESVQGFNCTQEAPDMFPAEYFDDKIDCSNHLEYDSFWVGNRTLLSKEQSITADIDAIFGDDMNTEFE